jgi:hypothetical protein
MNYNRDQWIIKKHNRSSIWSINYYIFSHVFKRIERLNWCINISLETNITETNISFATKKDTGTKIKKPRTYRDENDN